MCNWVVNCTARDDTAHKPNSKSFAMRDGVAVVETGIRESNGRGEEGRQRKKAVLSEQMAWEPKLREKRRKVGKKEGKEKQRQRNVEKQEKRRRWRRASQKRTR